MDSSDEMTRDSLRMLLHRRTGAAGEVSVNNSGDTGYVKWGLRTAKKRRANYKSFVSGSLEEARRAVRLEVRAFYNFQVRWQGKYSVMITRRRHGGRVDGRWRALHASCAGVRPEARPAAVYSEPGLAASDSRRAHS